MQHLAWWSGTVGELTQGKVVETLARRLVETHAVNRATQIEAWRQQVSLLSALPQHLPWRVLLEFPLLRLGRRIDAILLTDRAILVLEFKIGNEHFGLAEQRQVEDYALDLMDFHAGSRRHPIVPILIATAAPDDRVHRTEFWPLFWHGVSPCVLCTNAAGLAGLLAQIDRRIGPPAIPLDATAWEAALYAPVPTIVEAATMLYARHGVADIAAARADATNLTRTTAAIRTAVDTARSARRHMVVFVTGIPGAGKTLCGLNAVFGAGAGAAAAFLTGNLPLVYVLREALARDAGRNLRVTRQQTESAIQPLLGFLRDNQDRSEPPHEHVIVFDEAQRAWDAAFGLRRFGRNDSEAALFLDIMQRHDDFAVIIALVGNGQEINTGEAGLAEWGRALQARPLWSVVAAPDVFTASDPRQRLFAAQPDTARVEASLHLDVPVRSIRSALAAPWVDAVLQGDQARACDIAREGIPFLLTRSLATMRAALRRMARGNRRAGLVCSAGADRLRAEGIWPDFPHLDERAVANWFLNWWPDVRASDALEVPATQFACQGLEFDLVGLCWGGDLIRGLRPRWIARAFRGTRWTEHRSENAIRYQINTYRVLLTRARYETVIWVPEGAADDDTRDRPTMDCIAAFLAECGAETLPVIVDENPMPAPQTSLL